MSSAPAPAISSRCRAPPKVLRSTGPNWTRCWTWPSADAGSWPRSNGPRWRSDPVTQILLASRNAKKLAEMRRIVAPLVDVEVIGLDDIEPFDEVPETGATFQENALIKARDAYAHTGLLTVADDSGLTVDALNGMPGVLSARWAGPAKDDHANLRLGLTQVADVPDERLGAAFVCAIALIVDGREQVVLGRMPGH